MDKRQGRGLQKKLAEVVAEEAARHPDTPIETFATDEHRLGLKPVTRRVWAAVGERPIAHGHRFEWLYVTAFVSPATGVLLVRLERRVQAVLRGAAAPVRRRGRRRAGAAHRPRARQRRLARRGRARRTACASFS